MYDIAICDDVTIDRKLLINSIVQFKKYSDEFRIHEYDSGSKLICDMENIRFAVIFLDVQMEGMDGEQTAEKIRKIDDSVVLVFYTGYAEPTPHSIEVQPYRFIKKNMTELEKNKYVEDALNKMMEVAQMPVLVAKTEGRKLLLRPDDIVYIEKYRKSVRVHISQSAKIRYYLEDNKEQEVEIRISDKLGNLYTTLKSYGFGYPHDSYIVNFKYLMAFAENEIRLEGFSDITFKIARSKAAEFNNLRKNFLTLKYGR